MAIWWRLCYPSTLALILMRCKDYVKLKQSLLHFLEVAGMEIEYGLASSMELVLYLLNLSIIQHFSNVNKYTVTPTILNDLFRFSYFSRACLDYLVKSGKQPDILHIHNWETAIVGPLFWDIFVNQGLGDTRILFTCHNFNSHCLEPPNKLALCGLDPNKLHRLDRLQDSNKTHLVNLLKGGIVYSNKVVAVSSFHSKERIIRSATAGLESTLAIHREKLLITPHGFEDATWDPSKDELLPAKYSANNLKGKAICKIALRQRLGLSGHASAVVVGYILSETSGVDMENLKIVVWNALRKGAQFVFMRFNDTPAMNSAWESFQNQLKDADVKFINKYDEALLHLVLAGCDIILCSTFDDPMTQTPLKAIKYGAAPITIKSRNDMIRPHDGHDLGGTAMSQYMITAFANLSLNQAIDEIRNDPTRWNWIVKDGMSRDLSWNAECHDIHWDAYMSIKNLRDVISEGNNYPHHHICIPTTYFKGHSPEYLPNQPE
ncbi:hypothetical protein QJS04_geneDACA005367 [Acorus gramineus]|uniref:starch synthase n=1 Tax=Acorus gramineus TaxID=55184 RepID=A0AAV9AZY3_ACOGR|nr:hypothetical protein QJS04_geneDACA005367 [Acorus gramineus]